MTDYFCDLTIDSLHSYALKEILRRFTLKELIGCERVSKYWQKTVNEILSTQLSLSTDENEESLTNCYHEKVLRCETIKNVKSNPSINSTLFSIETDVLEPLFRKCLNVKRLIIKKPKSFYADDFEWLMQKCPQVECFHLDVVYNFKNDTSKAWSELNFESLPQLKHLSLNIKWINDELVNAIVAKCPTLEEICLYGTMHNINHTLTIMGPQIKKIHICPTNVYDINQLGEVIVNGNCRHLLSLKLTNEMTPNLMSVISQHIPTLKYFGFSLCPEYDISMTQMLSKLRNLEDLEIMSESNQVAKMIPDITAFITNLNLRQLKSMKIVNVVMDPLLLAPLANCLPNIQTFIIDKMRLKCSCFQPAGRDYKGRGCKVCETKFWLEIGSWRELRTLDVNFGDINLATTLCQLILGNQALFLKLKSISLKKCNLLSSTFFKALALRSKSKIELNLVEVIMSETLAMVFKNLPRNLSININFCSVKTYESYKCRNVNIYSAYDVSRKFEI